RFSASFHQCSVYGHGCGSEVSERSCRRATKEALQADQGRVDPWLLLSHYILDRIDWCRVQRNRLPERPHSRVFRLRLSGDFPCFRTVRHSRGVSCLPRSRIGRRLTSPKGPIVLTKGRSLQTATAQHPLTPLQT